MTSSVSLNWRRLDGAASEASANVRFLIEPDQNPRVRDANATRRSEDRRSASPSAPGMTSNGHMTVSSFSSSRGCSGAAWAIAIQARYSARRIVISPTTSAVLRNWSSRFRPFALNLARTIRP